MWDEDVQATIPSKIPAIQSTTRQPASAMHANISVRIFMSMKHLVPGIRMLTCYTRNNESIHCQIRIIPRLFDAAEDLTPSLQIVCNYPKVSKVVNADRSKGYESTVHGLFCVRQALCGCIYGSNR